MEAILMHYIDWNAKSIFF